ncbi:MAG: S-layer homology domain-containing protein [Clostridia bacterium]|nr:S-layer homology domain-containing protein [Clostridia bacterium]
MKKRNKLGILISVVMLIASVSVNANEDSEHLTDNVSYSDVQSQTNYSESIIKVSELNIMDGYEDGTFRPDEKLTRAEMSKIMVAAMGHEYLQAAESFEGDAAFTDTENHWANSYIAHGVALGIINGMGDGSFAPEESVTFAQTVKMLVRVFL